MRQDHELRDHVISTSVSLLVGAIGYAGVQLLSTNQAEAVALAVVAGIITHLIFDRIAYRRKIEKTRNEIIESLRIGTPFEAGFRVFEKEREAIEYLIAMLPTAKAIWNTRISDHSSVFGIKLRAGLIEDHDAAIMKAISGGAEYRLVVEKSRRQEIDPFLANCLENSGKKDFGGGVIYTVEFNFRPVTQMLLFETSEGTAEVLIGWGMGNEQEVDSKVLLFRDKAVVDFYRNIFNQYTKAAEIDRF